MIKSVKRRGASVLAVGLAGALVLPAVAHADNFVNDVTVDVSDTITAGGSTTVRYKVNGTGGDGQAGCNASDGSPAVVTISAPTGVVLGGEDLRLGNKLHFAACNDFQSVTFSSSAAGTYNITHAVSDSGAGTYSNQANWSLKVNAGTPSDTTPPEITPTVTGTLGNNGWYTSDVSLSWDVADAESAISSTDGCETVNITTDQAATNYTCSATSTGGTNSETVSIKRDGTAPVISDKGVSAGTLGSNGWYTTAVTNQFEASDALSGLAGGVASPHTFTTDTGTAEGSTVKAHSGAVSDQAGNTNDGIGSAEFKVDRSNPTDVVFVGGPAADSSHYFGQVPTAPSCTAEDAVSGLESCVVTGYSTAVGPHTLTATATDKAGRTTTATRQYTVAAWTLSEFGNPVTSTAFSAGSPTWNVMKGGRTVPLKFTIHAGSTALTSTSDVKSFKAYSTSCVTGTGTTDFLAMEETSTGSTSLRYDATEAQFIQNWKTPTVSKDTCYRVELETQDGSKIQAFFRLTK